MRQTDPHTCKLLKALSIILLLLLLTLCFTEFAFACYTGLPLGRSRAHSLLSKERTSWQSNYATTEGLSQDNSSDVLNYQVITQNADDVDGLQRVLAIIAVGMPSPNK
jgi:hypothetical protein